jgi:predicted phage terminase large subunit-like protein
MIIRPQPKQNIFLGSPADIAIYGGAAGGGKSWSLLVEPLRHIKNPLFQGLIFRRERPQITNPGGLWHESMQIYPGFTPIKPNQNDLLWKFPNIKQPWKPGATISFDQIQYETTLLKYQGAQIPFIGFDELTHFSEHMFFYMLSRNRSMSGVKGYVRASCNPDADSWLAKFISFWLDEQGFADESKSGRIRYFVRDGDAIHWSDSIDELANAFPEKVKEVGRANFCKSVTFIPASVYDNQELLKVDPAYLGNLLNLPLIERERLLRGNWKIRAAAGKIFNRGWFPIVDYVPNGGVDVRFWDLAATAKTMKKKDPDFTATVKIRYFNDHWTVIDAFQIQTSPANVEKLVINTAKLDREESKRKKTRYVLRWEIEPGSASRRESYRWTTKLRGIDAKGIDSQLDKISRAREFAVQAEFGNVSLLNAHWNEMLLSHLHGQPDLDHDDLMDAAAGAFNASLDDFHQSI